MSSHWSLPYIGLAYDIAGDGPDAFNCWSFFRHVERERFGRELPAVPGVDRLPTIVRAFRDRSDSFGWRRLANGEKRDDGDAVLMSHRDRPHHVGVWVDSVPACAVLHCTEGAGSVLHSPFHLDIAGWNIVGTYRPIGEKA